jgi:hypothetical protein
MVVCCVCAQARDLQELQNRFNAAEGANLMLARSQGESLRLADAARAEAARARDALAPATAEIGYVPLCRVALQHFEHIENAACVSCRLWQLVFVRCLVVFLHV